MNFTHLEEIRFRIALGSDALKDLRPRGTRLGSCLRSVRSCRLLPELLDTLPAPRSIRVAAAASAPTTDPAPCFAQRHPSTPAPQHTSNISLLSM